MRTSEINIFCDGIRLAALIQSPDETAAAGPRPAVVICSGLHGVKEWVPSRFWPSIVSRGFHCAAFDYRGFGASDGERGRMIPEEEVRDTLQMITYLRGLEDVDAERIVLVGWGLGAGIAIEAAVRDAGVAAVCCANGAGHYGRTVRDAIAYPVWLEWQQRIRADRLRRVRTGQSERIAYAEITHPGDPTHYDTGDQLNKDLKSFELTLTPSFTLETCEAYIDFRPENNIGKIAPRPLLILHGEENTFMPLDEAHALYRAAGKPKQLHIIPGADHLGMIDPDQPAHAEVMTVFVDWLQNAIKA